MSSPPHRASSTSSEDNARKRVCKACDRCRLKKSKCDGSSPCSRCKADNAICVFGERKKSHDKIYPKGYVEMLEQQQNQLVTGLRELYRRLQAGESWPGAALKESHGGHPLTHDILERLDLLHSTGDSPIKHEGFDEDFSQLQRRCESISQQSRKRRSPSEESEPSLVSSGSSHGMASPRSMAFGRSSYPSSHRDSSRTSSMDTQFLLAQRVPEPAKPQQYDMSSMNMINGMDLLQTQQSWMNQISAEPLEMDTNFAFNTQLSYDPQTFAGFALSGSETMPMWNDPFNDFIQPNALSQA